MKNIEKYIKQKFQLGPNLGKGGGDEEGSKFGYQIII